MYDTILLQRREAPVWVLNLTNLDDKSHLGLQQRLLLMFLHYIASRCLWWSRDLNKNRRLIFFSLSASPLSKYLYNSLSSETLLHAKSDDDADDTAGCWVCWMDFVLIKSQVYTGRYLVVSYNKKVESIWLWVKNHHFYWIQLLWEGWHFNEKCTSEINRVSFYLLESVLNVCSCNNWCSNCRWKVIESNDSSQNRHFLFTEFSPHSNVNISWCDVSSETNRAHSEPYLAAAMLFDVSVTLQCLAVVLLVPCVWSFPFCTSPISSIKLWCQFLITEQSTRDIFRLIPSCSCSQAPVGRNGLNLIRLMGGLSGTRISIGWTSYAP